MEEEIDLRPYIEALIKNWKWIVGVGVVTAVIAFIVTSLRPPTYSATAIVTIIDSRDVIQLDKGIADVVGKQPLAAFPELALSDEVLRATLEELSSENSISITNFRRSLEAESGADKSVFRLTAKADTAGDSAQRANIWAETFVEWGNRLYQGKGGERLSFFEQQLTSAESALTAANVDLEAFQAINRTEIISNTLGVYQQNHIIYLQQQERIQQLHENAVALRQQIENVTSNDAISYVDQLTFLQLQLQAFNDEEIQPVILDVSGQETLTTASREDQIAILDGLIETLAAKTGRLEAKVAEVEPQILTLQQEQQAASAQLARLEQNVAVAEGTYNSLAFQVEEERIIAQDTNSGFQLASKAAISERPLEINRLIITIVLGFLGVMISIVLISAKSWWQNSNKAE